MINCRKYTRYLHKSEVTELKWYEKVLMNYHYLICHLCKKYTIENEHLNQILKENKTNAVISDEEIEQYKDQLMKKIQL
jgi:hypothetical protein